MKWPFTDIVNLKSGTCFKDVCIAVVSFQLPEPSWDLGTRKRSQTTELMISWFQLSLHVMVAWQVVKWRTGNRRGGGGGGGGGEQKESNYQAIEASVPWVNRVVCVCACVRGGGGGGGQHHFNRISFICQWMTSTCHICINAHTHTHTHGCFSQHVFFLGHHASRSMIQGYYHYHYYYYYYYYYYWSFTGQLCERV